MYYKTMEISKKECDYLQEKGLPFEVLKPYGLMDENYDLVDGVQIKIRVDHYYEAIRLLIQMYE